MIHSGSRGFTRALLKVVGFILVRVGSLGSDRSRRASSGSLGFTRAILGEAGFIGFRVVSPVLC